jgi:hypothetical protein
MRRDQEMKNGVFCDVTPFGSLRTDVSEELRASIISVTRIGELGTTLTVTSNRSTLRKKMVTANIPSLLILVAFMMVLLGSSET